MGQHHESESSSAKNMTSIPGNSGQYFSDQKPLSQDQNNCKMHLNPGDEPRNHHHEPDSDSVRGNLITIQTRQIPDLFLLDDIDPSVHIDDDVGRALLGEDLFKLVAFGTDRSASIFNANLQNNNNCENGSMECEKQGNTQIKDVKGKGKAADRDAERYTGSTNRSFQPTRVLLGNPNNQQSHRTIQRALAAGKELNPNYHGEITEFDIHNASTPAELNCSVYVTNISPMVAGDLQSLFAVINTGKVYAFHLSPPEPLKHHRRCAAIIAFFDRSGAENFLTNSQTFGIWVYGVRIHCVWNRNRVGPTTHPEQSRVLIFRGPKNELSIEVLQNLFAVYLYYSLVHSMTIDALDGEGRTVVMEFGSVRAQAESAFMCFKNFFGRDSRFSVTYGRDPCEPGFFDYQ